jgi:hypothetical protein
MTLLEALEHIHSVEKCDPVAAQEHLKQGIGDRMIPVKWADLKGPNDKPDVTELRHSQLALSGPGLAPGERRLRPLLVLRPAVHAMWPQTATKAASPPETNSNARSDLAPRNFEKKYQQWMSLVEAIEHIRMSQHCDSVEALRQLKREINGGMVWAQWGDSEGRKDCPDPQHVQASQLLLIGTGFAPDNDDEDYRPLLVERSAVQKLWPLANYLRKDYQRRDSHSADQQHQLSASKTQIRKGLRGIYAAPENDRPNQEKARVLLRAVLPNARKKMVYEILREPEFAKQRRLRGQRRLHGNQPKS